MKVVKFGGSSLASASQLEKVLHIVKSDAERRFVVVSAPGKRDDQDTKVTDALIKYYRQYIAGNDVSKEQNWIIKRYSDMVSELGLKSAIIEKISKSIISLATLPIENNEFLYDTFLFILMKSLSSLASSVSLKMDRSVLFLVAGRILQDQLLQLVSKLTSMKTSLMWTASLLLTLGLFISHAPSLSLLTVKCGN